MPDCSKMTPGDFEKWIEMTIQGVSRKDAMEQLGYTWKLNEVEDFKDERWVFITLTQPKDDKGWERIVRTTRKILGSKQVAPIEWMYAKELTTEGTPHIHLRIKTLRYVDRRVIHKFNDNYRVDVQTERWGCYDYLTDVTKSHPEGEWFFASENYSGPRVSNAPSSSPASP